MLAGDYDNAIDYLVTMGGIAKEDDYEYLGQDNFCKKEYMAYSDKHQSKLIEVKVSGLQLTRHCQFAARQQLLPVRLCLIRNLCRSPATAVQWVNACTHVQCQYPW